MKAIKVFYLDIIAALLLFAKNYLNARWNVVFIIEFVFTLMSFMFWFFARVQLGKYFAVKPEARGLVTSGLYSKFRNPIYFFSSLALFGAILPSKNIAQYSLLVLLIIVQIIRAKKEEKVLLEKFGDTYKKYASKTWL